MGKFYGKVGYGETVETSPDIWEEQIVERAYYGDVLKNSRQWEKGEGLNDNLKINNSISVVADAYAYENFASIRYVEWMGAKWKVTNVEVQRPRLIFTLGGVYNGPTK